MEIDEVRVQSTWTGMSSRRYETRVAFTSKEKTLGPVTASVFSQLLSRSPLAKPEIENLGITETWLAENLPTRSLEAVVAALPWVFLSFHTDDYPHLDVRIKFKRGQTWTISSASQAPFMLPLTIRGPDGSQQQTFDADLSRAIGDLLPDTDPNRARILGKELRTGLSRALGSRIDPGRRSPSDFFPPGGVIMNGATTK